jgi:HPt (histidine-containing phosphotransfer) domain-containing protein
MRDTEAPPPAFGEEGLSRRVMGDQELGRVVIAAFLEDIPIQIEALDRCLQAQDPVAAGRQAHAIKGAAAAAGADAVSDWAQDLEYAGRIEDLNRMKAKRPELERHLDRFKEALRCSRLFGEGGG